MVRRFHPDSTENGIAIGKAISRWRDQTGRSFPTNTELCEILVGLGWKEPGTREEAVVRGERGSLFSTTSSIAETRPLPKRRPLNLSS